MESAFHPNRKGSKLKPTFLIILSSGLLLVGCAKKEVPPAQESTQVARQVNPPPTSEPSSGIPLVAGDTITTASGLKYIEVTAGQGANPTPGQLVGAHYTGWLTNGTKFDSSRDSGMPIQFPIGRGNVIKGWDEGLASMKVGGRRMLIIPPVLAYGDRGTPGGPIPPGAILVFDVELVSAVDPPPNP